MNGDLFNWPAEDPNQEDMYEWAIHYLDLGWNIMPIASSGKKPHLWRWEQYQTERVTPELIEEWWGKNWPLANIALICGRISGIVCFDLDDPQKCPLDMVGLPYTATSKTARGQHFFFNYPDPDNLTSSFPSFKGPGFDLQSDGKYVILPPSEHSSGAHYEWLIDPWRELTPFSEIPQVLIDHATTNKLFSQGDLESNGNVIPLFNMDGYFEGVNEGGRNNAATKLAGYLFNNDRDYEEVLCTIMGWNLRNKPPLSQRELITVVHSVSKKHNRRGV